jgi:hypothetical protein
VARPTKLTPELQAAYLDALKRSWYLETAADLAGIDRGTVRRWIKRGRRERRGCYHEFCTTVKKAAAERLAAAIGRIEAAEEWQASAWLLERNAPEKWSNHRRDIAELKRRVNEIEKQQASRNPSWQRGG